MFGIGFQFWHFFIFISIGIIENFGWYSSYYFLLPGGGGGTNPGLPIIGSGGGGAGDPTLFGREGVATNKHAQRLA